MTEQKECNHSLTELCDFAYSAKYLSVLLETIHYYPNLKERADLLIVRNRLREIIERSLDLGLFISLKKIYIKPDSYSEKVIQSLNVLHSVPMTWIPLKLEDQSLFLGESSQEEMQSTYNKIFSESRKYLSPRLLTLVENVELVMMFDCLIPESPDEPELRSKPRLLYALSEYWSIYSQFVSYISSAYGWFTPDPMLKYRINLKKRIEKCIKLLDASIQVCTVQNLLEWTIEDIDGMSEEVNREIARGWEEIENLHSEIGHFTFEMNQQENMFVSHFNFNFQKLRAKAEKYFSGLLKRAEEQGEASRQVEKNSDPPSCFEYIRRVEQKMRKIIEEVYRKYYGDNWLFEIKVSIGEDAFGNAEETMNQRGVKNLSELLHYTFLTDLQQAIITRWNIFSNSIRISRKDFNKLLSPILMGRTEEAHNRPDHIWPEIEQQRVRVACNDLLKSLLESNDP